MKQKDGFKAAKDSFKGVEGFSYLSGEDLKKLQDLLYKMLCDLTAVLDHYNIFYTLSGGSVLGAIRHQGFIPWDDDIDINMTRESFESFKRIFNREMGDQYTLLAPEISSRYGFSVAHIARKGTLYKIFNNIDLPDDYCGIGFDIFVLENTFNQPILRKIHGYCALACGYLLNCRKVYDFYPVVRQNYRLNAASRKPFEKKYRIGKLISFISLDRLAGLTQSCYSFCKNNRSKYVTIPSGRKHYFGEMGLRKDLCVAKKARFRDLRVNIPKGSTQYMKRLYGDSYMVIPKVQDREQHPVISIDFGTEQG